MIKIDILTIFPKMFKGPFDESIVKRAQNLKKLCIRIHNLRDWARDKHRSVDAPPFGGGPGMIMRVDIIDHAVNKLRSKNAKVILLDTRGKIFNQKKAIQLAKEKHLIFICGHYEGVDFRVYKHIADEVISVGEYVLTGGELPTMVVVDSLARLLPGVLGNPKSLQEESYLRKAQPTAAHRAPLEYPQYTRPAKYKGWQVPKVLLSGNHAEIEKWRQDNFK